MLARGGFTARQIEVYFVILLAYNLTFEVEVACDVSCVRNKLQPGTGIWVSLFQPSWHMMCDMLDLQTHLVNVILALLQSALSRLNFCWDILQYYYVFVGLMSHFLSSLMIMCTYWALNRIQIPSCVLVCILMMVRKCVRRSCLDRDISRLYYYICTCWLVHHILLSMICMYVHVGNMCGLVC